MSTTENISAALLDYLWSTSGTSGLIDVETDLLDLGLLDSLLVMDLVCFLEVRYQIKMLPADVNPNNLRSVGHMAHFVNGKLSCDADAA
jgi:acyl carrier protein